MSAPQRPVVQVNGLPSVREDPGSATTTTPISAGGPQRDAARLNMLRRIRPPPLKYAWSFYHDKHSDGTDYEGRLTLLLDNIVTLKPFWEAFNRFPLNALKMKDSVHFFKRGVRPVWEDLRNVNGGSWTFRIPKDKSAQFWMEALLLAVGEQFADAIQAKDDLCGLSLSTRFNSNLITIWNRDGSNQKSIDGILAVVLDNVAADLRPKEGSYYYKKHSEHAGFSEALARKATAEQQEALEEPGSGKIEEAKIKEGEVERQEMEYEAVPVVAVVAPAVDEQAREGGEREGEGAEQTQV